MEGKVEKIGFRSTKIRNLEKSLVTVSNKKMIESELENLSEREMIRAAFPLSIDYAVPFNMVQEFINELRENLNANELLQKDPIIRFSRIRENAIEIQLVFFVLTRDIDEYIKVREDVLFSILAIAQKHKIQFTSPAVELKQV